MHFYVTDKPIGVSGGIQMLEVPKIEIQKLDRKTKEQAKMMFLGDYDLYDISETLNINMDTLRFFVFGENGTGSNEKCWHQIKKKMNPTSIAVYLKDKVSVLDKTSGIALSIVTENLNRIKAKMDEDPSETLSIDDTRKLASIVVDMDKIVRLESGKATSIIEDISSISIADAKRILAEDPFSPEVVEADFEELDDIDESFKDTISSDVKESRPWND